MCTRKVAGSSPVPRAVSEIRPLAGFRVTSESYSQVPSLAQNTSLSPHLRSSMRAPRATLTSVNLGMHHLHRRRRASSAALSPFDYLMYGVGLVQPLALLPQISAIYLEHSKVGVSMATWLALTVFNTLWAIYGYRHRAWPIMIANIMLAILDIAIVAGVLWY